MRQSPLSSRRDTLTAFAALALTPVFGAARPAQRQARRIVTLDASLLETVCLLGGADRMVGADNRDRYPRAMEALPRIGDPRAISVEGVLSLAPDLVLRTTGRGPDDRIRALEAAGVRVMTLPADYTLDNVILKVRTVAEVLGENARGERIVAKLSANRARLRRSVDRLTERPRVLFALDIDRGELLVAGTGTPAAAMIGLAGGIAVPTSISGFRRIASEAFIGENPAFVLMGDHTVRRIGGVTAVLALPPMRAAGIPPQRLIEIESVSLLGFGPRATHALAELIRALHPSVVLPSLEPIEFPE